VINLPIFYRAVASLMSDALPLLATEFLRCTTRDQLDALIPRILDEPIQASWQQGIEALLTHMETAPNTLHAALSTCVHMLVPLVALGMPTEAIWSIPTASPITRPLIQAWARTMLRRAVEAHRFESNASLIAAWLDVVCAREDLKHEHAVDLLLNMVVAPLEMADTVQDILQSTRTTFHFPAHDIAYFEDLIVNASVPCANMWMHKDLFRTWRSFYCASVWCGASPEHQMRTQTILLDWFELLPHDTIPNPECALSLLGFPAYRTFLAPFLPCIPWSDMLTWCKSLTDRWMTRHGLASLFWFVREAYASPSQAEWVALYTTIWSCAHAEKLKDCAVDCGTADTRIDASPLFRQGASCTRTLVALRQSRNQGVAYLQGGAMPARFRYESDCGCVAAAATGRIGRIGDARCTGGGSCHGHACHGTLVAHDIWTQAHREWFECLGGVFWCAAAFCRFSRVSPRALHLESRLLPIRFSYTAIV
jgi:hypothetical protein